MKEILPFPRFWVMPVVKSILNSHLILLWKKGNQVSDLIIFFIPIDFHRDTLLVEVQSPAVNLMKILRLVFLSGSLIF